MPTNSRASASRSATTCPLLVNWQAICDELLKDLSMAPRVLQTAGVTPEYLATLSSPPEKNEAYGRRVLFSSDKIEVMLATWKMNVECEPHDHGASRGVVLAAEGAFVERSYSITNGELVAEATERLWPEGSLIPVATGVVHSMRAVLGGMSLHIYTHAIKGMKVFDRKNRETLVVVDDCGAWIPENQIKIVSRTPWAKPGVKK